MRLAVGLLVTSGTL